METELESKSETEEYKKLVERVGPSWASNLSMMELFGSEQVKEIGKRVAQSRRALKVYPEPANVFRAFRETPLDKVSVVIMGQDPYNDMDGQATGLAMDCGKRVSPTIQKILEQYDKEYPSHFNTELMNGHLLPWAQQGVLLLNAALTVEKGNPKSHLKIWKPFTRKIVNILMYDYNPKVFVALGDFGLQIIGKVTPPHVLLSYEHPVRASYEQREWKAGNFFHEINKHLRFMGREEINW